MYKSSWGWTFGCSKHVFFFLSSTTLCEFWLAQLFLSMVSFPVPSVSNYLLPSSSNSSLTSSSHLNLRLPFGLVVCGFHFINVFNYSFIRHSFNMSHPTQSLTFNVPYYIFMVNQFFQVLICFLSPFFFCVGSKILLNNLISNTNNFCLMFSVNTQHSDPYTTYWSDYRMIQPFFAFPSY